MKNKVALFFLVVSISLAVSPISANWRDIFGWKKRRTSTLVVNNPINEGAEQKKVSAPVNEKVQEVQKVKENLPNKIESKNLNDWQIKMAVVAASMLMVSCFFSIKAVIALGVLAYIFKNNSELMQYTSGSENVNQIIDGINKQILNVFK